MEVGTIRQINIENEMQASYLDYAMSVIVARALPDVRDGLKPVHRRILYAMHDLGLTNDKPYKKSARIVGEVLGKYHPHGDAAVYEAMVRMAQDFSLRYPLVDGQGNFGSVDGDNAAAMRYTEARLAAIADEMLADIDKDTVEWTDNFDGTLREPSVLPAALPNLLVNGSSGIAVGMATNIPPHNLGEVCDALCYLIDNYDRVENVNTEDLMRFIQGPDFPTGGVIFRYEHGGPGDDAEQVDAIERAYGGGRGSLVMQAKAHLEEMSRNRSRIVVTELPYQTDKSRLIERIAELVRDGRLEGITDLRDESDRTGMRVCIEMTRTVDPRQVLADLYKLTPLQSTFGVSLLALVDGEPRLLGLKKLLQHFIEHRREVIERRSRYELEKARQRAHILEGLLRALDLLDEIIALIRRSRTADAARLSLVREFQFSELQAQAILDMQLRRLAALERQKLQDEYKQVQKLIKELEALLNSPQKVLELIKQNLIDLKARYGDARRTQIADRVKAVLTSREHDVERDVWVALGQDGRLSVTQRTAGAVPLPLPSPAPLHLLAANTRQDVYLFTVTGRAARVLGHQLPDAPGAPVSELAGVKERIAALLALTPAESDDPASGFLLLGSALGKVKRVALADLFAQAHTSPQVIGLDSGDELAWAAAGQGQGEVLLMTAGGQSIRFAEEEVRPMGLPAGGVGGIKLRDGDRVVAGLSLAGRPAGAAANTMSAAARKREAATTIAVITAGGFGKQAALADFPPQGRFGGGVVAAKIMPKSGNIVGAALLTPGAHLVCLGASGSAQPLAAKVIPAMARATQGKAIPQLAKIAPVTRIYAVDPGDGATSPAAGPKDGQGTASSARPAAPGTNGSRTKPASDGAGAPTGERGSKGADTGPTAWSSAGELRDPLRGAEPLSPVIAAGGPAPAKTKRGVKTSGAGTASNAGPARTAKPSPEPTPEPSGRKAPASQAASAAPLTAPPSATPARLTSSGKGSAPAATAAEMATPAPPGRRGAGAKSAVKPASTTEPASASMPPTAPAGVGRRTARPAASDAQLPLVPEGDPGEGAATRRAGRTASGAGVAADNATASKTAATGASTTTGKATAGKPTATGAGTKTGKAVIGEAVKGSPASGSAAPAKGAASKAQTGKNAPAGNTGDKAAKGNAAPGSAAPAKAAAGKAQTGKDATGSKAGSKAAGGPASKDAPAAPPSPPVTLRPKRSASDGPMTWPLIPPTDEGDDEPPSLPKRGPSRPGR